MAFTFNASVGVTYDADPGFFDGPEQLSIDLAGNGIGSVEGFGTGEFTLFVEAPPSIASAEAFGTAKLNQRLTFIAIPSAEVFGTQEAGFIINLGTLSFQASVGVTFDADPGFFDDQSQEISSAEAFGAPRIITAFSPVGIISAEGFGTSELALALSFTGIISAEAFGTQEASFIIDLGTVSFQDSVGTTFDADAGFFDDQAQQISSAEAFGTPKLNSAFSPISITTLEAFGTFELTFGVSFTGIVSAEVFSIGAEITHGLTSIGIVSSEVFGVSEFILYVEGAFGIVSEEAFGTAAVGIPITPVSIVSEESFGSLTFILQWDIVSPSLITLWNTEAIDSSIWTPADAIETTWTPESVESPAWNQATSLTTNWSEAA